MSAPQHEIFRCDSRQEQAWSGRSHVFGKAMLMSLEHVLFENAPGVERSETPSRRRSSRNSLVA